MVDKTDKSVRASYRMRKHCPEPPGESGELVGVKSFGL